MARPRAVFFDIGNVLLRFDSKAIVRKIGWLLGHHPLKIARFLWKDGFIDAVERGQLPARRIYALFRSELDYNGSFREFSRLWCDHFTLDRGAASLLRSLSRRLPVYLLSNTNALHYRHILRRYAFPRQVRGAVLSYKLGLRKPQPEIYLAALRRARCAAEEAVFIDDLKENVAAAGRLGLHAIRYTGSAALRRELKTLGL